jgi:hypothetical protein
MPGQQTTSLLAPDPGAFGTAPMNLQQPTPAMSGFSTGSPLGPSPFVGAGFFPPAISPEIALSYGIPALLSAIAVRRGQPLGPTNDQECEDFIYDALELLPGTSEVEVRCEGGRATLTGSVQHKRLKRDVGEIAWAIPVINDVQNNITIATKRRARVATREGETHATPSRKQA